jgi:hypothetical protein
MSEAKGRAMSMSENRYEQALRFIRDYGKEMSVDGAARLAGEVLADERAESLKRWCKARHAPDAPQYCQSCRFYLHQRCQRHAPICRSAPDAFAAPVWPRVQMDDVCGDLEGGAE